jgi:hypothetical protein
VSIGGTRPVYPDGIADDSLGSLPNTPAPERAGGEYTGDQTSKWVAAPGSVKGIQPVTATNPDGDFAGVPVMAITAEVARTLSGRQPG